MDKRRNWKSHRETVCHFSTASGLLLVIAAKARRRMVRLRNIMVKEARKQAVVLQQESRVIPVRRNVRQHEQEMMY
jgi:hypothetical protein